MRSNDGPTGDSSSQLEQGTRGIVALDVGGTTIHSAIVCEPGRVMNDTARRSDARSGECADVLLDHFTGIIDEQLRRGRAIGVDVVGIGFAFPGPFDYENGICLIRGLHKFDAIYGVDLRAYFSQAHGVPKSAIRFMNDADAFAVGESAFGVGQPHRRAIYLTVGTGIGSAFIEQGQIVNNHAPFEGRIFQAPYGDGVADDYLSRRGVLRLASELRYPRPNHDVVDIAEAAFRGEPTAVQVFERFASSMADVLRPVCDSFGPDGIVFGGQIAKSSALFLPALKAGLDPWRGDLTTTDNALHSTWRGLYQQFLQPLVVGDCGFLE